MEEEYYNHDKDEKINNNTKKFLGTIILIGKIMIESKNICFLFIKDTEKCDIDTNNYDNKEKEKREAAT